MILKLAITNKILDSGELSLELAMALNFTQTWIRELARNNKENGPLTTAKALQVIGKETGLANDEILEEDTVKEGSVSIQS